MPLHHRLINCINLFRRSDFHYYRMAMLKPPYWLRANGRTCRVLAGGEAGSASCYAEVVVEDCYRLFRNYSQLNPRVIVDIGANIGMFSRLCSMLFPEADIYAYEPNPLALKYLEQNATATSIKVLPYAVGENSGAVNFNTSCDTTLGQVTEDGNLTVNCIAASQVADGRQIDLLKMDCEGSEWSILRDTTLLARTSNACIEYHLGNKHTLDELKELVEKANHKIVGIKPTKNDGEFGVIRTRLISGLG